MVRKKLNYDMPSSFVNEIEAPLRRDSKYHQKKRKVDLEAIVWIVLILLGVVIAVASIPEAEAHLEPVIVAPSNFCEQAARDLLTWDREASPELKEYCNNI